MKSSRKSTNRIRSDVTSLNTDTADGVIDQLSNRFGVNGGQPRRGVAAA